MLAGTCSRPVVPSVLLIRDHAASRHRRLPTSATKRTANGWRSRCAAESADYDSSTSRQGSTESDGEQAANTVSLSNDSERQGVSGGGGEGSGSRGGNSARVGASWASRQAGTSADAPGQDYLEAVGSMDYNTNVDVGQSAKFGIDSLFLGNERFNLGGTSDIADGSLRRYEFSKFDHLVGDYFISPAFLETIAVHMAKNFVWESLEGVRLPLILGIWGPKGCGKTFQTELAFKKLGVEAVVMSAGELEHEWAGTPGRMIRERYRKAAEMSKVRGKMTALVINDIDAGVGHFAHTQTTVNNQMVVATLMNICDNPTQVAGAGNWREMDIIRRIPIIVTGNDFSTLFAPLIRDGRMSKFFWKPNRMELLQILMQMYKDDDVGEDDLNTLLDEFPEQPLDFFGAIRAGTYDAQILAWIREDVVRADLSDEDANMAELSRRLVEKDKLPTFSSDHVCLEVLLEEGRRIAAEQDAVARVRLANEYMGSTGKNRGQAMLGLKG